MSGAGARNLSSESAIAVYDTEIAFATINLFLCFNISKVTQNLSKFSTCEFRI